MKDPKGKTVEELRKNLVLEIGEIKGPVDWFDELARRLKKAEGIIAEVTALSGATPRYLLVRIRNMVDLLHIQQKELSRLRDSIESAREAQNKGDGT